jgi:hypothetical protein
MFEDFLSFQLADLMDHASVDTCLERAESLIQPPHRDLPIPFCCVHLTN